MTDIHTHKPGLRLSALLGLLLASLAVPAALAIDIDKSKVSATFRQIGVPVEGIFTKAAGSVQFDPAKPEAASASIEIDMSGFDLGLDDYNAEVRKKEWFDTKTYPKATFVSTAFKALGGDRYRASGKLSLKGKVVDVSVPVTVKRQASATVFDGSLPLSRKAFGIGDPEWGDVVDDAVIVTFHIVQPQ